MFAEKYLRNSLVAGSPEGENVQRLLSAQPVVLAITMDASMDAR